MPGPEPNTHAPNIRAGAEPNAHAPYIRAGAELNAHAPYFSSSVDQSFPYTGWKTAAAKLTLSEKNFGTSS